jgi:hypothetical protein
MQGFVYLLCEILIDSGYLGKLFRSGAGNTLDPAKMQDQLLAAFCADTFNILQRGSGLLFLAALAVAGGAYAVAGGPMSPGRAGCCGLAALVAAAGSPAAGRVPSLAQYLRERSSQRRRRGGPSTLSNFATITFTTTLLLLLDFTAAALLYCFTALL